jgi:hypothetical protein
MPCVTRSDYNSAIYEINEDCNALDYYETPQDYDDLMCAECGCFAYELGDSEFLCLNCRYHANVKEHGLPTFDNEFWLSSPCLTGENLRKRYKFSIVDEFEQEEDRAYPEPVNTFSVKYEEKFHTTTATEPIKQLLILKKKHKKTSTTVSVLSAPPKKFSWNSPN